MAGDVRSELKQGGNNFVMQSSGLGEMAGAFRLELKKAIRYAYAISIVWLNGWGCPFGIETSKHTTVALLFEEGGLSPSRKLKPSKRLGEVSLQSESRLFQHGKGQFVVGGKTLDVDPIADLPMRSPGAFGHTLLMMGREVACLSHKPTRVLLCHPGKPFRRLWLKREHATLGTDHHVVPLLAILHARDDMHWLAGRCGCGRGSRTSAGSRRLG